MLGLSLKFTKTVGGWGFAPDPTGGAYDAPPDPLVGSILSAPLAPLCPHTFGCLLYTSDAADE